MDDSMEMAQVTPLKRTPASSPISGCTSCCQQQHVRAVKLCSNKILQWSKTVSFWVSSWKIKELMRCWCQGAGIKAVSVRSPAVDEERMLCVGSRPSDHYFRSVCLSVCWFFCLFVCAEFFSAVFDPISIKLGHMLYVWVQLCPLQNRGCATPGAGWPLKNMYF